MRIFKDAAGLRASRNPFDAACSVAVPCWLERAGALGTASSCLGKSAGGEGSAAFAPSSVTSSPTLAALLICTIALDHLLRRLFDRSPDAWPWRWLRRCYRSLVLTRPPIEGCPSMPLPLALVLRPRLLGMRPRPPVSVIHQFLSSCPPHRLNAAPRP